MNPPPTVGRMVHYISGVDGFTHAAIITAVNPDMIGRMIGRVSLAVFSKDGAPFTLGNEVDFSEQPRDFHWTWPPRV